jgi:predicted O-methyltransferase YrrM
MEWFENGYRRKLGRRYETFAHAFALVLERSGPDRMVVETGCVREKDDYSAGYSTVLIGELLSRAGGHLATVDLSERNMAMCKRITKRFAPLISYNVSDSVDFLRAWPSHSKRSIDLLYLDSWDYPVSPEYGEPEPSQRHCLLEFEAALPSLSPRAVVLIDDADLPGGGKPRLAKVRLAELGWECVLDDYQTLWVAPGD